MVFDLDKIKIKFVKVSLHFSFKKAKKTFPTGAGFICFFKKSSTLLYICNVGQVRHGTVRYNFFRIYFSLLCRKLHKLFILNRPWVSNFLRICFYIFNKTTPSMTKRCANFITVQLWQMVQSPTFPFVPFVKERERKRDCKPGQILNNFLQLL